MNNLKFLTLTLLALALNLGAKAQTLEVISSFDKSFKGQLSREQLAARFAARVKARQESTNYSFSDSRFEIVPDTLYEGEPFDVHYEVTGQGVSTYELYDCRGKRPKKIATKQVTELVNGSTVLRFTLAEAGEYELVVYDADEMMQVSDPSLAITRQKITVHDRKVPQK